MQSRLFKTSLKQIPTLIVAVAAATLLTACETFNTSTIGTQPAPASGTLSESGGGGDGGSGGGSGY